MQMVENKNIADFQIMLFGSIRPNPVFQFKKVSCRHSFSLLQILCHSQESLETNTPALLTSRLGKRKAGVIYLQEEELQASTATAHKRLPY